MSETIKAGVIGHPIAHSKSPLIHGYWLKKYNIEGTYEAIDIAPENLKSGIQDLVDQGFKGFNITVPHKVAVMDLCDELDKSAQKVGAVNTVMIEDGQLIGTNTDVYGFVQNLREAEKQFGFSWNIHNGPAIVLGAGGAARAVIQGLLDSEVTKIYLSNRTEEKARQLENMAPSIIEVLPWEEKASQISGANLLVNTTILGMQGQEELQIDLTGANEDMVVNDIVYNPLYTNLLKEARQHDLRVVTGIGMLLHQARPGFEEWFDAYVEVNEELEDLVLDAC